MAKLSFFLQGWGSWDRPLAYYYPVSDRFWPLASHSPKCTRPRVQLAQSTPPQTCLLHFWPRQRAAWSGAAAHSNRVRHSSQLAGGLSGGQKVVKWISSCSPVIFKWHLVVVKWQSSVSQMVIKLQWRGSPSADWLKSGCQVALEWQWTGNIVLTKWQHSGSQVVLDWRWIGRVVVPW